ncbi:MAG TPA: hypothetical protein VM290_00625 [Gaiellaceae bacterium]|nr:hypothetical protein [Gaiellaceae bacterium]
MLRQGLIPPLVHGVLEYAVGAFLILAPFLFGFEASAAVAVSIVAGVLTLVIGASSDLPTGLARVIPVGIHFVLDIVIAAALIAAPFLFGFAGETPPTAVMIGAGIGGLLLTIGTTFVPGERAA